ncbi:MAG TPA: hypothetical protein RMH85_28540 [Polyangiaceae bacterium LLY-WYZ-15_(1-7)]|nr:hypothetical protein [Myxococcales bacterium]MAT24173.1 hypothetical protein [Sandaracinus sp.]HJK94779.1 hypothetical protein [Polyangiaceae bacterium LLY-WYZ-15_(1-7)]MBJ74417.1 hypothetical protein [Sandaracinus sp.]HJL00007.1 hypothetical protein [Polyangiaceae bacterium LLY-WYZ-15_(1-7)]
MALRPEDKRRYARHILLPEIGAAGQEALQAARFAPAPGPAGEVAALYLERAGLEAAADGPALQLEGAPEDPSDAAIAGAFAAVEHIKATLGVGTPGALVLPAKD